MESDRALALLEQFLFQKNVFVIIFDTEMCILYHNFPKALKAGRLEDFLFLLGSTSIQEIKTALADSSFSDEGLLIDNTAVCFHVRKLVSGAYCLEILGPRVEERSLPADLEGAELRGEAYQKLRVLLEEVQDLSANGARQDRNTLKSRISDHYLPALRAFRHDFPGDEILDMSLCIIENNLLELGGQSGGLQSSVLRMLTPSELQVAEFIREGKSSREIADALNIAAKTVENHRNNVRSKLGLANTRVNLQTYLTSLE